MAQGVVLRRALQLHEDHVVGVFHVAVEVDFTGQEMPFVQCVDPHRRPAAGPQGFALGMADVYL
ncbi:hypothetical protein D3C87_2146160 [compost metagenome]